MNKALRTIAVDLTPVLPGGENGGAKIFVIELLRRLAELRPDTQYVLLTQAPSHDELAYLDSKNVRRQMVMGASISRGVRPHIFSLASRFLSRSPAKLRNAAGDIGYRINRLLKRVGSGSLLSDIGADLLFCPFTAPSFYEPEIPTVCTIYDLQYKTYPEFFPSEDVAHRDRTFVEACRCASALTAISEYSRSSAIVHGHLEPSRIRTIYLRMARRTFVDLTDSEATLKKFHVKRRRYLMYPANFWRHKNHEMLLTSFGIASSNGLDADIKLICTGAPGMRQQDLLKASRAMGFADRILFPGYVSDAELAALLVNSSGVVFASLYEGFGLPVLEAMSAGVPVACSNITSLPEVAAGAAILFDPRVPTEIAEAIVALTQDEALRANLIQKGSQRAMEFSDTNRMANEYLELFQYAVANGKATDLFSGAHADGWAGPQLRIQVAPAEGAQTLQVEFFAPPWLPQPKVTVQASRGGNKLRNAIAEVKPGENAVYSLPIEASGGNYEIKISPTFVPASAGYGDDHRELSAMITRCGIIRAQGEYVELYSGKSAS